MYVDKPLSGLAAVQTLSRLNRTHKAKDSTFVLDFRNKAVDIRHAFAPYYVQTEAPPTDPNLMYDAHHQVTQFDVLRGEEVDTFIAILMEDAHASDRIHGTLEGAKARFWEVLDEDEQGRFRDALKKFVSAYGYLSQIVPFGDIKLERDYLFCRALSPFIQPPTEALPDVSGQVDLTHLATRLIAEEESISLPTDEGELSGPGEMFGRPGVPEAEVLSQIIKRLNERYGTNFDPADRLFFDGLVQKMADRADVQQAAMVNDSENFNLAMRGDFQDAVIDQMSTATDITKNFLDNDDFAGDVLRAYMPLLQTKARVAAQQGCPISELLGGETSWLEYKASLRTNKDGGKFRVMEAMTLKTVAAFLNSYDGGTLLVGVTDDGEIAGLENDFATLRKEGKDDADLFLLHLNNLMRASMGAAAITNVYTDVVRWGGEHVCRVHVRPCGFPVEATVTLPENGQNVTKTARYVRINNGTHEFKNDDEWQKYVSQRWPGA
ncbi:MAG: putative DNA binding domain-containing protein [Acidimicrobiales bacterium]